MKPWWIVVVVAGCSAEPRNLYVDSNGYWDSQTGELTVGATYLEYDSQAYYAHHLAAGEDVTASIDATTITLPKRDPIPSDLPDQDVFVGKLALTDAPDGKEVSVDVTGETALHSQFTLPIGFEIAPLAPQISRAAPIAITWAPRGTDPIQWWIHPADCLDPSASDHSIFMADDAGMLMLDGASLASVIVDPSGNCDILVTVQRVHAGEAPLFGMSQGIQTRNVTFTSIP